MNKFNLGKKCSFKDIWICCTWLEEPFSFSLLSWTKLPFSLVFHCISMVFYAIYIQVMQQNNNSGINLNSNFIYMVRIKGSPQFCPKCVENIEGTLNFWIKLDLS